MCVNHGPQVVVTIDGDGYCKVCVAGQAKAALTVDIHVKPRDCFVAYKGTDKGWLPITGTGCAHWVCHNKNLKLGSRKAESCCLKGFTQKVALLANFLRLRNAEVAPADVKVGDIWIDKKEGHCGIVSDVAPNAAPALTTTSSGSPALTTTSAGKIAVGAPTLPNPVMATTSSGSLAASGKAGAPIITIMHDSSHQHGVAENEWDAYFTKQVGTGPGRFYRYGGNDPPEENP